MWPAAKRCQRIDQPNWLARAILRLMATLIGHCLHTHYIGDHHLCFRSSCGRPDCFTCTSFSSCHSHDRCRCGDYASIAPQLQQLAPAAACRQSIAVAAAATAKSLCCYCSPGSTLGTAQESLIRLRESKSRPLDSI